MKNKNIVVNYWSDKLMLKKIDDYYNYNQFCSSGSSKSVPVELSRRKKGIEECMSFVGLHIMNDGIIGFADTKASRVFKNGKIEEDKKRGKIQKIFKNNKFIFVTYGHNEILVNGNIIYIENLISQYLIDNISYTDFFSQLSEIILQNPNQDKTYNFIIGSKDKNNKYFIVNLLIDKGKSYQLNKMYNGNEFGGDEYFCEMYKLASHYNDIEINKYSEMIRKYIEHMIQSEDLFSEYRYNPVGLPVNIEIFQ